MGFGAEGHAISFTGNSTGTIGRIAPRSVTMWKRDGLTFQNIKEMTMLAKRRPLSATLVGVFLIAPLLVGSPSTQRRTTAKKPSFIRTVYSTIDGTRGITMMSSSELEIKGANDENYVCKYSREGNVIRAVMTAFGTNRAIYYNVIPDGLQDKDGTVFFSTSALAAERQRVAQAQALDSVSQQPTVTIATVRAIAEAVAAQYSPDPAVVTLTDVDVRALKNGREFPARFRDISYIQTAKYYQYYRLDFTTRGGGGASVYFREEHQCDELAAAADAAIRAWKTKYPTVTQTQYYGIRKGSPIG